MNAPSASFVLRGRRAAQPFAEREPERIIARLRARAGQHQIAKPRQAGKRFRACAVGAAEPHQLGKAARGQRRRGAGAKPAARRRCPTAIASTFLAAPPISTPRTIGRMIRTESGRSERVRKCGAPSLRPQRRASPRSAGRARHRRRSSGPTEWQASPSAQHSRNHLGHEFVRAALDALGAGDDRRARRDAACAAARRRRRIACAGTTSRIASRARLPADRRDRNALVDPIRRAGTCFRAFLRSCSALARRRDSHSVTSRPARAAASASAVPQAPPPSTAMRSIGHCDVNRLQDAGVLAQCLGRATSSSGQRARGATSSGSVRPSASRSAPAQAIMAPLSVQSSGGGATSSMPASMREPAAAPCGSPGWRRRRRRRPARSACRIGCGTCASRQRSRSEHGVDHRLLERGAQVGDVVFAERRDLFGFEPHGGLKPGQREIRLRPAVHRPRQRETLRDRRAPQASRPAGRPDSRGRAASRSCRKPRRWRRPSWCRAAHSRRRRARRRSGCGRRRRETGNRETAMPSVSRAVSACASRWLIAISGLPWTSAIALAVVSPTMTPPIRPGPAAAAMPSTADSSMPASAIACGDHEDPAPRHGRARRFPAPRRRMPRVRSICDSTISDRMRPRPSRGRARPPPRRSRRRSFRCRARSCCLSLQSFRSTPPGRKLAARRSIARSMAQSSGALLRIGTRGSPLALAQARTVRDRLVGRAWLRAGSDRNPCHQDDRRPHPGPAAVGSRRQGPVHQGDRGGAAARTRSTSRCIRRRTCRPCCRTGSR